MIPSIEFYQISGLINASTSLVLGVSILWRSASVAANRYFAYFCLAVGFWSVFYFLWLSSDNLILAEFYLRTCMIGVFFIPATFFHFVYYFLGIQRPSVLIPFNYYFAVFVSLFTYTPLYAYDLSPFLVFQWLHPGPLFHVVLLHFASIAGFAFYLLYKAYSTAVGGRRTQIYYVFISLLIAWVSGSFNYLCWYRIPIPPVANMAVALYVLLIAYAIFRYQLLDIKILIRRSLIYTSIVSCISVIYFLFIFLAEHYLKGVLGYSSLGSSLIVAILMAIIVIPLKELFQTRAEKYFFKASLAQLAEKNDQLHRQLLQLQCAQYFSRLVRSVMHTLVNPVASLQKSLAQIKDPDNPSPKSVLIETAYQNAEKINELITMLNDYKEPVPPKVETLDIHDLLDNKLEILKQKTEEKNIVIFKSYFKATPFHLSLDKNQFYQALDLLFESMLTMMPKGGQIWVGTDVEEEYFLIFLKDTGTGIPPDQLARMDDPYFRLEDRNKGDGLALAFLIIENYHGRIFVESDENSGTEFTIHLPLS